MKVERSVHHPTAPVLQFRATPDRCSTSSYCTSAPVQGYTRQVQYIILLDQCSSSGLHQTGAVHHPTAPVLQFRATPDRCSTSSYCTSAPVQGYTRQVQYFNTKLAVTFSSDISQQVKLFTV